MHPTRKLSVFVLFLMFPVAGQVTANPGNFPGQAASGLTNFFIPAKFPPSAGVLEIALSAVNDGISENRPPSVNPPPPVNPPENLRLRPTFSPLPHQNQFTPILALSNLGQTPIRPPRSEGFAIRISQNYTAIHLFHLRGGLDMGIDTEQLLYRIDLEWVLGRRLGVRRTEPPGSIRRFSLSEANSAGPASARTRILFSQNLFALYDGFLDPFLRWYHNLLYLPNYGREDRPDNEFEFFMVDNAMGTDLMRFRKRTWYATDPVIGVFHEMMASERRSVSGSLHISLPLNAWLGSDGGGRGPEAVIFLAGLHHVWVQDRFQFYHSTRLMVPLRSEEQFWEDVRTQLHLLSGAGWQWNQRTEILAQFHYGTPYHRGYNHHLVSGWPLEVVFGVRRKVRSGVVHIAFSEDLLLPAPDFTLQIGLELRL